MWPLLPTSCHSRGRSWSIIIRNYDMSKGELKIKSKFSERNQKGRMGQGSEPFVVEALGTKVQTRGDHRFVLIRDGCWIGITIKIRTPARPKS